MTDNSELIERLRSVARTRNGTAVGLGDYATYIPGHYGELNATLDNEAADALATQAARIAELEELWRLCAEDRSIAYDERHENLVRAEKAEARVSELERQIADSAAKNARLEAVITSTISEVELMKAECVEAITDRNRGFYAGLGAAADSMMIAKARTDCGEPETWLHEKVRELEAQLASLKKEAAEVVQQ